MVSYPVLNVHLHGLGQVQPAAAPQAVPAQEQPVASGPQPRWVTVGSKDLLPTLAATGTVAALVIAGIVFLK